jgi:hypothetical protein
MMKSKPFSLRIQSVQIAESHFTGMFTCKVTPFQRILQVKLTDLYKGLSLPMIFNYIFNMCNMDIYGAN